jgi:hypothetical protein
MFPTLPSHLSGSGLMDDAVVVSEGQPLDDSQATRLNDLDHTEDGSVSSSGNSEGRQGTSLVELSGHTWPISLMT